MKRFCQSRRAADKRRLDHLTDYPLKDIGLSRSGTMYCRRGGKHSQADRVNNDGSLLRK